jgi:hypothetical protein
MTATDVLWQRYRDRFNQSRGYRPNDEPSVALAYNDWLASFLRSSKPVDKSNVIAFKLRGSK